MVKDFSFLKLFYAGCFFMKKLLSFALVVFLAVSFSPVFVGCSGNAKKISRYEIECELTGEELFGKEKVTFYNSSENALQELKFNLYGNAFRKGAKYSPINAQYRSRAYYAGENYGDMKITSVRSEGENLEYSVCGKDENVLSVALKGCVYPEERVTVDIEFTLKLAKVVARTGINTKTVNLANFYPVLCAQNENGFFECEYYSTGDPFFADAADYKVSFTAEEKYCAASGGKVISSKTAGGRRTTVYELDCARSFALVLSESFESVTTAANGTEINYYYYKDEAPEKTLKIAEEAINLFGEKFGKYPYPVYAVVQTEFLQGGMEFSALSFISDALEERAYKEVVVHETAHQWWQAAVGNNEVKYGFLDEGLTEYSVVIFYENYPEYGYTRENLVLSSEKTFKTFCSVYDKLFKNANTAMLRPLSDFSSEYEYVNVAYVKPVLMYDLLRNTVGDERFFKAVGNYYSKYKFKIAEPYDIAGEFEKVYAGTEGIFKSFYEGKEVV